MRLKSITINNFKRFTGLTIQGIPETARLIMLAGPNGSGKSSLFDALHQWRESRANRGMYWDADYYVKRHREHAVPEHWQNQVTIEFHSFNAENSQDYRKTFYIRSAYRNDPEVQASQLNRMGDLLDEIRFRRMIENDAAVGRNYQRLVSNAVEDIFERAEGSTTLRDFRAQVTEEIADALRSLFPYLEFDSLGNPLTDGTFRFTKGTSRGFVFKNLSGGEKAAFDLILDLVVTRHSYDDTVFCIDEPESHMNARIQAGLLSILYELTPPSCQLMLATHSIGMMRCARDIEAANPGSVVFLDFGGREFDESVVIEPTMPDRAFWGTTYEVALDDLAALVAPEQVVICEGEPRNRNSGQNYSHDARCYERIFQYEFPEIQFIPGGNAEEVADDKRGIAYALGVLTQGTNVIKLIDRDASSEQEMNDFISRGIRVLSRRNLESVLFDDEVLRALAQTVNGELKIGDLLSAKQDILDARPDDAPDDLKPASGEIYLACKNILGLTNPGNTVKTFMRDTLAPCVRPGMGMYDQLKHDIFG